MLIDVQPSLFRFVIQRLGEHADLRVRQSLRRSVGVLTLSVIMQDQQRQPRAIAGLGVFQHLAVAGRIAERNDRPRAPIIRWMPSGLPALLSFRRSLGSLVRIGLPLLS